MSDAPGRIAITPSPEIMSLIQYFAGLDEIHGLMGQAQKNVEEVRGFPICLPECKGLCCQHNSVVSWGVEAEYAASVILGTPGLLADVLDRCRDWLTEPGKWTYGKGLTMSKWKQLKGELFTALSSRCPFVTDEGRCLLHACRPMVCMSEDTQILTNDGWLGVEDVEKGHIALTMDLCNGSYSEQAIEHKMVFDYSGEVLHFGGVGRKSVVDALLTTDHRVVYRTNQRRNANAWQVTRADTEMGAVQWPISGPVDKEDMSISDDMLRVLGWIIGDGTITYPAKGNGNQPWFTIYQGKPIFVDEIRDLLQQSFGQVNESVIPNNGGPTDRGAQVYDMHRFYIGGDRARTCYEWLGSQCHRIPRRILASASTRQLGILYDTMIKADGTVSKRQASSRFFPGKEEGLADDMQELCTRMGLRSSITLAPSKEGSFTVNISPSYIKGHTLKTPATRVPYTGRVWCVSVPNSTFVARRNGRVFTTGNCRTYGLTRMPGYECPRPKGNGEDDMTRVWFDPDNYGLPIRPAWNLLLSKITEQRYVRQGFFALMIFERFRAKELAGLIDDGKIPLVKLHVGWGGGLAMLWQEQLDDEWTAVGADKSIRVEVPLIKGTQTIAITGGRRR